MKYYRLRENWDAFKTFRDAEITNPSEVGFMHRDNEIIVASLNDGIVEILRSKYELEECEQPSNYFDKDRDWGYANKQFFETKP